MSLILGFLSLAPTSVHAGPGNDHGPEATPTAAPSSPRIAISSEAFQFVGVVEGEALVIYLDRATTNEPVTTATIDVSLDGEAHKAALQTDGTFEIVSPRLKQPGSIELLVTIADGESADLLVGALTIPQGTTASAGNQGLWRRFVGAMERAATATPISPGLIGPGAFGFALVSFGIFLGTIFAGARRVGIAALVIAIMALATGAAVAHEGHDHGPAPAANGNAPQRRPDGAIFLPKATQRLLEVRTLVLAPSAVSATLRFNGRVIANPNRSGVVQGTISGRFVPPEEGMLPLGSPVRAGQILGRITPSFASIDASQLSQTLAELDQQIALNRQRLARQEQMLRGNAVPVVTVEETRFILAGQIARRSELVSSRVKEEELRAPVDGVIAATRVVAGQVVATSDRLFEIVDPTRPLVEALVFDPSVVDRIADAEMALGDGTVIQLRYLGRSRTLQQQYSIVQFEVIAAPSTLSVGLPVSITARIGAHTTGLVVPRVALAQAPNGQTVVFQHTEPEVFTPRAVRFEPIDSRSVLIVAGVRDGDKIVVRNAPLVNQVR